MLAVVAVGSTAAAPRQAKPFEREASVPIVPQGTIIPLKINNTINSRSAYVGEAIYAETTFPVTGSDRMLIPAHSYVRGMVTDVVLPGRLMGKAQLGLRFTSLTLPDGLTRPIQCIVYSIAGTRLAKPKKGGEEPDEGGKVEADTTPSAEAAGSVIDASGLGGVSALSAASAGVSGLVLMLVSHNKEILLQPGTTLEIQLTSPLDFAVEPAKATGPPRLQRRPQEKRHHAAGGTPEGSGGRISR
jgi:hypothetical protein